MMKQQELVISLYSPLTADFYPFEEDAFGFRETAADAVLLDGRDLTDYADSVRESVSARNAGIGSLMEYFDAERNPGLKAKVESVVPSVEVRNGELMGCAVVKLRDVLNKREYLELCSYLHGQYADGWGEGFEQQDIQTREGVLNVHFAGAENFAFEMEAGTGPRRPKMNLIGEDGNIFAILGRASRLLRENGQADKAKEMHDRVCRSGNYAEALHIVSEYVETELTGSKPVSSQKRSEPER